MRKFALLTSVAVVAFDNVETVMVQHPNGEPVMVNKADFDADQADDGPKHYKALSAKKAEAATPEPTTEGVPSVPAAGVLVPPAPSAPNFTAPAADVPPTPIDAATGAATPTTLAPGQMGLVEEGRGAKARFFAAYGDGSKVKGVAGIDEAGYADQKAGWDAITAVQAAQPPVPPVA